MPAEAFLDSNIVIYAFSGTEPEKQGRARALLDGQSRISVQVLNEVASVLLRRFGQPASEVGRALEQIASSAHIVPLGLPQVRQTLALIERYRYGYYDSLIISAALDADCSVLYSEDMHAGQRIERLLIQNPFSA